MANNFNWRTDEDFDWDEEELTSAPQQRVPLPWRRPALLLTALLVVAAAIYLVTRRVEERVDTAAADVSADVLSSFDLLLRAAEKRDRELFVSLLSGRDPGWTEAEKMLLDAGLVFGRQTFGLQLDEAGLAENRPVADNVTLSSDFSAAEITFRAPYETRIGNGLTAEIILEHTQIYRRGNDQRWLLAPPLDEFWGEWDRIEGQRLRVRYPTRDEVLSTRLAADLDSRLAAMCGLEDVDCPADLLVELRLGDEPGTLLTGLDKETQLAAGPSFNLPAPTLVGTPVDEAGYQALLRGYATHIVSALLTRFSGYECCDHPLYYQALLDRQLDRLAIQPWPLSAADYNELLNTALPASRMFHTWTEPFDAQREGTQWRQVYALIDFILNSDNEIGIPEMQRRLNVHATYTGWLYDLVDYPYYDEYSVNRDWQRFLHQQAAPLAAVATRPFPAADPTLVCYPIDGGTGPELLRFDTETLALLDSNQVAGENLQELFPLPDGRLLVARQSRAEGSMLFISDGAAPLLPVTLPVEATRYTTFVDSYTELGVVLAHSDNLQPGAIRFSLLEPGACAAGGCSATPLPGPITPSPDGSHILAFALPTRDVTMPPVQLLNGAFELLAEVGEGWFGGWLDGDTYYFVNSYGIYGGNVGSGDPELLLNAERLRTSGLISDTNPSDVLGITSVAVNPDDSRQLLVAHTGISQERQAYTARLILLNLDTGELSLFAEPGRPDAQSNRSLDWYYADVEVHGSWLQVTSYSPLSSSVMGTVQIFDWEGNLYNTYVTEGVNFNFGQQWSPDHNWLAIIDQNWTRIVAPGTDFQQLIYRGNEDGCYVAFWSPHQE